MSTVKNTRAFLGMSHTPLLGLATLKKEVEDELLASIALAKKHVLAWAPDRIVLIAPDHYNGFFNELMPSFCIGSEASSVGDYLMPQGPLNVDAQLALDAANFLMDEGFDPAMSRRMRIDHGFSQPLQLIWGSLATPPVLPIFVNALAPPTIPRMRRCRELGQALGRFLDGLPGRTLLLGSGGLSHEPPVPTMAHPDSQVRDRITLRSDLTEATRAAKIKGVIAAGLALASGESNLKPLNPAWDKRWMDALELDDMRFFDTLTEESITSDAGQSGHESKAWLIARAAMPEGITGCTFRRYQAIDELIAGFGLMFVDGDTARADQ